MFALRGSLQPLLSDPLF